MEETRLVRSNQGITETSTQDTTSEDEILEETRLVRSNEGTTEISTQDTTSQDEILEETRLVRSNIEEIIKDNPNIVNKENFDVASTSTRDVPKLDGISTASDIKQSSVDVPLMEYLDILPAKENYTHLTDILSVYTLNYSNIMLTIFILYLLLVLYSKKVNALNCVKHYISKIKLIDITIKSIVNYLLSFFSAGLENSFKLIGYIRDALDMKNYIQYINKKLKSISETKVKRTNNDKPLNKSFNLFDHVLSILYTGTANKI